MFLISCTNHDDLSSAIALRVKTVRCRQARDRNPCFPQPPDQISSGRDVPTSHEVTEEIKSHKVNHHIAALLTP